MSLAVLEVLHAVGSADIEYELVRAIKLVLLSCGDGDGACKAGADWGTRVGVAWHSGRVNEPDLMGSGTRGRGEIASTGLAEIVRVCAATVQSRAGEACCAEAHAELTG